jgi:hypothetical protein
LVDLLVNGRLIAKGEVVVIGNHFGVKVTQVHKPENAASGHGGEEDMGMGGYEDEDY